MKNIRNPQQTFFTKNTFYFSVFGGLALTLSVLPNLLLFSLFTYNLIIGSFYSVNKAG